ncbi:carboxylate--amine ligase [Paenibacillus sp. FSL A5-0031]|nr:carboxylate--amine ligase [Paenibacillus sp. FSL A5-0031]
MNAYNMAISFHKAYQCKPILIGREHLPFTQYSSVIEKIEIFPELGEKHLFASFLIKVAEKYGRNDHKLLLVGTNDLYVRLIIEHSEQLQSHFIFNYTNEHLMNQLQIKSNFYHLCEKLGIETPITYYYDCRTDYSTIPEEIAFPIIIKPSNGISYYQHKFTGQQKVYKVSSLSEMNHVISTIKNSGYDDELIIQDYIPGDDSYMWDSVLYINSYGKTQIVTFAQVVLQEHTVTAIGNYTALITRFNKDMMGKLQRFLEAIGYVGFANFDIKFDQRDGTFKVFEVNIRQGRSSYYITSLGYNMAEYIVDDLIYNKDKALVYLDKEFLFTVVPKIVLRKFVADPNIRADVKKLLGEGRYDNPLFYKDDHHLKRKFFLFARQMNYYRKYRNNQW